MNTTADTSTLNPTADRFLRAADEPGHPIPRALPVRFAAALAFVFAVAAFSGAVSQPAGAAAGTTSVTVCVTGYSSTLVAHSTVTSYWWNGSSWVSLASGVVNSSGCRSFSIQHNGYIHFMAYSYMRIPCTIYTYQATTAVLTKQQLPVSSRINLALAYYSAIPVAC